MDEAIAQAIIHREDEASLIQFEWVNGELFPYHLEISEGEYTVTVDSDQEETVIVVELDPDNWKIIAKGKTKDEVGKILLHDRAKYGIYVGRKDVTQGTRPDSIVEGNARFIPGGCSIGCIKVCTGPCPPGYYNAGPCGTCGYGSYLLCCCKVP